MSKKPESFQEDDLVTVAKFGNPIDAHLAKTKLDSENISSYVFDENMISMNPTLDLALGGIRLKVKKSEALKAFEILDFEEPKSFWTPSKTFFFTYLFGEYLLGALLLLAGILICLVLQVFDDVNIHIIMFLNLGLVGTYVFTRSKELADFISSGFPKKKKNMVFSRVQNTLQLAGPLFTLVCIGQMVFNSFWLTQTTIFFGFISLGIWFFVFRLNKSDNSAASRPKV